MGLLVKGTPLSWEETKKYAEYIKENGIIQFGNIYNEFKNRKGDVLYWGDEVEYIIVKMHKRRGPLLSLRADKILEALDEKREKGEKMAGTYVPEYANYMVEGTPVGHYSEKLDSLITLLDSLKDRRKEMLSVLKEGEYPLSITMFPLMGVGRFTDPYYPAPRGTGEIAQSNWVPDEVISPHPRFRTLTANIRERRGEKVKILMPMHSEDAKNYTEEEEEEESISDSSSSSSSTSSSEEHHEHEEETARPPACKEKRSVLQSEPITTEKVNPRLFSEGPVYFYLPQYYSPFDLTAFTSAGDSAISTYNINSRNSAFCGRSPKKVFHCVKSQASENDVSSETALQKSYSCFRISEEVAQNIPPPIEMDCMAFGMGCACLQCTFQTSDIDEARFLYDQLGILCPYILCVTASTPIVKGMLADTDVRWGIIAGSVDDRTREEREEDGVNVIHKSRYDSISCFIYKDERVDVRKYNNIPVEINEKAYKQMMDIEGMDELLATHMAHLFCRDPLVVFSESIYIDNNGNNSHFENIQTTNWQTVRFKPPPPHQNDIGWRVEFRVMESQLTDYENTAFFAFVNLLVRVLKKRNVQFYIPVSHMDYNIAQAHKRGAVRNSRFKVRRFITWDSPDEYLDLTISEIMNGKAETEEHEFPGLIPLVRNYLDEMHCDGETRRILDGYLDFVSKKASGELCTTSEYFRGFVRKHPSYKHNCVVTRQIATDLMQESIDITYKGKRPRELFGEEPIAEMM